MKARGEDALGFRAVAADAIIGALKQNFVTAWELPAQAKDIPTDGLVISIGTSDRLSGPVDFRSESDVKKGVPLTELPPPLGFRNDKGENEKFHFDPAHDSGLKDPTANGVFVRLP